MLWAAAHLLSRPGSAEISIAFNKAAGADNQQSRSVINGNAPVNSGPTPTLEQPSRESAQTTRAEKQAQLPAGKAAAVAVMAEPPEEEQAEPAPTRSLTQSISDLYIERIDSGLGVDNVYTITLQHTGAAVEANALTLTQPSRLVVDLAGNWPVKKGNPEGQRTYGVGVVERMRVGRRKGNLRVVVDIRDNRPYEYAIESAGNQVQIRLWAPGQN